MKKKKKTFQTKFRQTQSNKLIKNRMENFKWQNLA